MSLSTQTKLIIGVVLGFLLVTAAYVSLSGAPSSSFSSQAKLAAQIQQLQQQLTDIQNVIKQDQGQETVQEVADSQLPPQQQQTQVQIPAAAASQPLYVANRPLRSAAWQPMKRLAAWQPMKRSEFVSPDLQRDQLIRAIENQLSDVLHAGETLGISAEDVLSHLRQKNDGSNGLSF